MDLNLLGVFRIAIAVGVWIDIERDEGRLVSVSLRHKNLGHGKARELTMTERDGV